MPSFLFGLIFLLATAVPVWSDGDSATQSLPAKIINAYNGGYKDDYPQELSRVQTYVSSAQSDIATQLGLRYGQGFFHSVAIRFDDGAPTISENPFFYVRAKGLDDDFHQDLIANVEAFAKRRSEETIENNLRSGFRYAITAIMLNDLTAGDSDKTLPLWVQEGFCVYASGKGDELVQKVAERTPRSKAADLVEDLNSPGPYLTKRDWANYYLAIKYINGQGGTAGLQAFVREMMNGRSPADAVRDALGQEWPAFTTSVRDYSLKSFSAFTPDDEESSQPATH